MDSVDKRDGDKIRHQSISEAINCTNIYTI